MKKTIINIACLFIATFFFAHFSVAQGHMSKGTTVVQAGIGLGGWTTGYTTSETPIIAVTFEKGIKDNFGNGNLSVGGSIVHKSGKYSGVNYNWKYGYIAVAGRASWHPHFINSEKLDAYTGISLGYYHVSTNYDSKWSEYYDLDFSGGGLALAGHVGARYNFTESLGAWAELGFGLGILNAGISYTF